MEKDIKDIYCFPPSAILIWEFYRQKTSFSSGGVVQQLEQYSSYPGKSPCWTHKPDARSSRDSFAAILSVEPTGGVCAIRHGTTIRHLPERVGCSPVSR